MSTATIAAAGNVRPLSAIKADMANSLAQQPQAVFADIKGAIMWLPRKAQAIILRAARFLHIPQFAAFVRTNFARFLGVVGKGAFTVEVLTSHWGQSTIVKGIKFGARVLNWATRWSWKIVTSPLRLFTPTRNALEKFETVVEVANAKLTPNSGTTFGPLQIARDIIGYYISADRAYMKVTRITALAVMSVRATRRFVPVGWLRVLSYVLDGLIISRAYSDAIEKTWLGKKLNRQTKLIEADVVRQGETVVAEATHMTRESATKVAEQLRREADQVEAQGIQAARVMSDEMAATAAQTAEGIRSEAAAVEATAERMTAAETAAVVTENLQAAEEGTVAAAATVLRDRPKPGPAVPPAPSSGPQQQPHQRHGGGKPKPPKNR